jgi:ECF transporter S component (folate family)
MKIKKIIIASLLLASTIVLSRILSIRTPILTIGFSFVPIMLSGIILGPKYTIFISTLADIIGALLFPIGSFFYGFTITAFLTGLVYGIFLYNKDEFKLDKKFIIKSIIAILIVTIILNGVLNTIWIKMTVKDASKIIIVPRVIKQLIMIPVKFLVLMSISKLFGERINKLKHD